MDEMVGHGNNYYHRWKIWHEKARGPEGRVDGLKSSNQKDQGVAEGRWLKRPFQARWDILYIPAPLTNEWENFTSEALELVSERNLIGNNVELYASSITSIAVSETMLRTPGYRPLLANALYFFRWIRELYVVVHPSPNLVENSSGIGGFT